MTPSSYSMSLSSSSNLSGSILTLDDSSEHEKTLKRTSSSPHFHLKEHFQSARSKSARLFHEIKHEGHKHDHHTLRETFSELAKKLSRKKAPPVEVVPRPLLKSIEDEKIGVQLVIHVADIIVDPSLPERLDLLIDRTHNVEYIINQSWKEFQSLATEAGLSEVEQDVLLHLLNETFVVKEIVSASHKIIEAKKLFKKAKNNTNAAIDQLKKEIAGLHNKIQRGQGLHEDASELKNSEMRLHILQEQNRTMAIVSGDPLLDEEQREIEADRLKVVDSPRVYVDLDENPQQIKVSYECFLEVSESLRQFEFRKEFWLSRNEFNTYHIDVQYVLINA